MLFWRAGCGLKPARGFAELRSDEILCGPGRKNVEAVIWGGFEKKFDKLLKEFFESLIDSTFRNGLSEKVPLSAFAAQLYQYPPLLYSVGLDDVRLVAAVNGDSIDVGIAAIGLSVQAEHQIIGLLVHGELAVHPAHQGKGIGRGIVAAEILSSGCLPSWSHDKPGYTPSGAATVIAGYEVAKSILKDV